MPESKDMSRPSIIAMAQKKSFKEFIIWYLRQPFVMIVWFMETFAKNRGRIKDWMARPKAASLFKTAVIATFFIWIGFFAFLSTQEDGDRFSCAVKSLWSGFDSTGCDAQPWQ